MIMQIGFFHIFKQNKYFLYEDMSKVSTELFENCFTQYHNKNLEGKEIKVFKLVPTKAVI